MIRAAIVRVVHVLADTMIRGEDWRLAVNGIQ